MFKFYRVKGVNLNPSSFCGQEPSYTNVYLKYAGTRELVVEEKDIEALSVGDEVLWISLDTYRKASSILGGRGIYEAHEGATITACRGAWLITGEVIDVEPPIGVPKGRRYVIVNTELGKEIGLEPFIVEKDFVFRYIKGEDIEPGRVARKRLALFAYSRSGAPLSEEELKNTLLWKNYLSNEKVQKLIASSSRYMKKNWWHIERMSIRALSKIKVVWRDVAKKFIPAVDIDGTIPDYTVNYVVVNEVDEAYYLTALLLSPQINAVVEELSPWIGHVQPRFIRYFRIPPYNPANTIHRNLAEIGKKIQEKGFTNNDIEIIEELVNKLYK